ncbi:MAG: type I-B CRISPR-associated endonuclease Cas1b [Pyrinomonadaceae bacterium]
MRRKDNTLCFEPIVEDEEKKLEEPVGVEEIPDNAEEGETLQSISALSLLGDSMGDLAMDSVLASVDEVNDPERKAGVFEEESGAPVRVRDRRSIPVEDVDALWVFGELDLNARVLVFLSQHKIPVHFFNYYGFYAGTYYPREYLQAGYLLVRQVRHYSNRRLRMTIAREFVGAGLHNILRNLRYYATRGADLQAETESVQAEILRLDATREINELMSCEGRARAAYYRGFSKILRQDVEFTKRVRRPPDNMVNALISFTNGLVYSATLSQIYRSQLNPTISFLHEPGARRFSLALDLAEVFKPVLADRLIFKLLNNRQLSERDFATDLNCCYLKESGRKTVLKEWDARLGTQQFSVKEKAQETRRNET